MFVDPVDAMAMISEEHVTSASLKHRAFIYEKKEALPKEKKRQKCKQLNAL